MIEITAKPISPALVIDRVRSDSCGCVVTYVGLIRNTSQDKAVLSVEYQDSKGKAEAMLKEIANEAKRKWQVEHIAISRRIGKLNVGEINQVVAVASAHRSEGFAACQYIIDQLKECPPTRKMETYKNGNVAVQEAFREAIG